MRYGMQRGADDRASFPPLVRVQIEQLACCAPSGLGLNMTHWSLRSLAQMAVVRKLVPSIALSTVWGIVQQADLQPHRFRYWKTARLDETFVQRAAAILWRYESVDRLRKQGEWVVCFDEKPNLQALQRCQPHQPLQPGRIERQEFEYRRHGTVNFAVALRVADGQMRGWCLDRNDSTHLGTVLEEMLDELKEAKRIHLIWDGGPSHTSDETRKWLGAQKKVRVLLTPPHASWLNQAELLLRAFSQRYLKRGDWNSRRNLIEHLDSSWHEYNQFFAHPFEWSWTRHKMRDWVRRKTQ